MLVQPSKLHKQLANSAELHAQPLSGVHATNSACIQGGHAIHWCVHNSCGACAAKCPAQAPFRRHTLMDRKRNQAALKGKEKVRAPPTRMSPRLAALRAPHSPPLKMRTSPLRASPRLAALKDSPLPLSPTSVLMPKKLLVLALAVPKPILPPVTPVQKDPEHLFWRYQGVLAERGPSKATTKEKVVINDSIDSETSKKVEYDNMELIAMDEPFVQVEEVEEEEEEEDPEEDPEEEEEGEVEYFRDEEDYEDYFSEEDDDSSDGSTGSN
ncbi:hypothetical protein PIB30_057281 [Stylosanthes scabra]|uniref:Uncharacterized protein n=1 Tax=Stylosanthes scabra TaxID=79078 RepID=A0ABU6RJK9_9FABA|nr:hypothetical protein [Stylosanthes scabra]